MSNNKQIEFDFSKWGQEGISVTLNGCQVITLHEHPNGIEYYGIVRHNESSTSIYYNLKRFFTMYEKVKPREKQTAVEWLQETLESFGNKHELQVSWATIDELFQQAKAMEEKELFEFFQAGQNSMEEGGKGFEQYYNQK